VQLSEKPYISRHRLEEENRHIKQLLLEMFMQACLVSKDEKWSYDHMCLSTYEDVQAHLISWGMIKPEECSRE
jgi:hypothetical protein